MIEAKGISKLWGDVVALDEVSLQVPRGSIHGLIGADGAGKSTLFNILVTLVRADSGTASVGGYNVESQWKEIRKTVGYMPANFSLYGDLSVRENLEFFAHIYGQPVDNVELIGDIWRQIEPFSKRPAEKLSGGMKQKLALCCAMIHNPDVLMLDEPTTGVDPTSRREFWTALGELAQKGKTILVSTSYMDEAAKCDRITLIHQGIMMAELAPEQEEIESQYRGSLYELSAADMAGNNRLLHLLRGWSLTGGCYSFGDKIHLSVTLSEMQIETVMSYLRGQGVDSSLISIRVVRPTVEDLFIQLTAPTDDIVYVE